MKPANENAPSGRDAGGRFTSEGNATDYHGRWQLRDVVACGILPVSRAARILKNLQHRPMRSILAEPDEVHRLADGMRVGFAISMIFEEAQTVAPSVFDGNRWVAPSDEKVQIGRAHV